MEPGNIDCAFAGALLNQCISSGFSERELEIPYYGLYGACSTDVYKRQVSFLSSFLIVLSSVKSRFSISEYSAEMCIRDSLSPEHLNVIAVALLTKPTETVEILPDLRGCNSVSYTHLMSRTLFIIIWIIQAKPLPKYVLIYSHYIPIVEFCKYLLSLKTN